MKFTVQPGRVTLAYLLTASLGSLATLLGLAARSLVEGQTPLLGANAFSMISGMLGPFVLCAFLLGLPVFLVVLLACWLLRRRKSSYARAVPVMLVVYVAVSTAPILLIWGTTDRTDTWTLLPFLLGYVVVGAVSLYYLALRPNGSADPLRAEVIDQPY